MDDWDSISQRLALLSPHRWRSRSSVYRPTARPARAATILTAMRSSRINQSVTEAMAEPVISVDTKKKEPVGDFKNAGREWRTQGSPEEVGVNDFTIKELGPCRALWRV